MQDAAHGEIVNLLIEHEEALADLYSTYEQLLPEMADFWENLKREELAHADILRTLLQAFEAGNMVLNERKSYAATTWAAAMSDVLVMARSNTFASSGCCSRYVKSGMPKT